MDKILLAIGHRELENFLERQLKKEFMFVGTTVYREGILRAIGQKGPDIIVVRETLEGQENILSIAYDIRTQYPKTRIVFLAGKREPGDELLATLVNYGIYDILYGENINAQDIVALIRAPNEYKDIGHLQPKPVLDEKRNKILFESPTLDLSSQKKRKKEAPKRVEKVSLKKPEETEPKTPKQINEQVFEVEGDKKKPINVIFNEVKENELRKEPVNKELPVGGIGLEKSDTSKKASFLSNMAKTEKNKGDSFLRKGSQVSKNQILTFIGGKHGVGNTSVAFNTAFSLAKEGNRVIFVELNERIPSVHYWYELGYVDAGIDYALKGVEGGNFKHIEEAIVRSKDLKKSNKDLVKHYKKFPNELDFMFFSNSYLTRNDKDQFTVNEYYMKELFLQLLFQFEYDFVVLDVEPSIWKESTLSALLYSHKVFITVTQDVSSIGHTIYWMNELDKHDMSIKHKAQFVLNCYEKASLKDKDVIDWLDVPSLCTVPLAHKDFVRANFAGLPVLASSNHQGLKEAFGEIVQSI